MPATSRKQLRAMLAAKAGKSTLGIPKAVGAEFVAATPHAKKVKLLKAKNRRPR
jgi:hypothetical protein